MTDVLAAIDAAVDAARDRVELSKTFCGCGCGALVRPGGPCDWFAGPDCQRAWHGARAADPEDVYLRDDATEAGLYPSAAERARVRDRIMAALERPIPPVDDDPEVARAVLDRTEHLIARQQGVHPAPGGRQRAAFDAADWRAPRVYYPPAIDQAYPAAVTVHIVMSDGEEITIDVAGHIEITQDFGPAAGEYHIRLQEQRIRLSLTGSAPRDGRAWLHYRSRRPAEEPARRPAAPLGRAG